MPVILSDLYLEPYLKKVIDCRFYYSEAYDFPVINGELVIGVFSNTFRNYHLETREKLSKLFEKLTESNEFHLITDVFLTSSEDNLISDLSNYDFSIGYYAQMPFNKKGLLKLASLIIKIIRLSSRGNLKTYFVDLDNTLIPGVWEEEKKEILENYHEARNGNFHSLASFLKMKASLGAQVIIVSKNDHDSISDALNLIWNDWTNWLTHIDSGWSAKHLRIERLLDTIGLSATDSLFIDDNPIEISSLQKSIPQLNIFTWQNKYSDFLIYLNSHGLSDNKTSEHIESRRSQYRYLLKSKFEGGGIESIQLNFTYKIYQNNEKHFQRVLELSKKTNQFNISKELLTMQQLSQCSVYTWDCQTEFGYLGIIGYALVDNSDNLINFVMSCRALGFNLEYRIFEEINALHNFKDVPLKITERNEVAQNFVKQLNNKYGINTRI